MRTDTAHPEESKWQTVAPKSLPEKCKRLDDICGGKSVHAEKRATRDEIKAAGGKAT